MAPAHNSERSKTSGSVAVVGAGISGLAAAYRLRKEGVNVTVFEAERKVGGKLRSESTDGYTWDLGPNSMVENGLEVSTMIDDLHLREKQQFPVLQNRRYIVLDGAPVLLPSNPLGLIASKILSTKSKLQILLEPFLWKRKATGELNSKDTSALLQDECVGDFFGRHLGHEAVENLVDPFVVGTTGSDPNSLSARHTFPDLWALEQRHGSLIMGAIKSKSEKKKLSKKVTTSGSQLTSTKPSPHGSFSFVGGLQTIANALAQRIGGGNLQLNTAVVALSCKQQGNPARDEWTVSSSESGLKRKANKQHFDAVILTVPVHNLHGIQFTKDGKPFSLDFIPKVIYEPMSVFITAFRKDDVKNPLQGFGVLIPSKEQTNGFQTLGTIFSSSMFPDRAPADQVMYTTFVGGSHNRALAAAPLHYFWERAFPQYGLNYSGVLESLEKLENTFPGLIYAGNHRGGLAVGKALISGYQAAGRVLESLEASGGRIYTMA